MSKAHNAMGRTWLKIKKKKKLTQESRSRCKSYNAMGRTWLKMKRKTKKKPT